MNRLPIPRLAAAVAVFLFAGPAVRADLSCADPHVQIGEAKSGQILAHRFTFVNRGPEAVEIVEVRPSCGCMNPRCDKSAYRPGEEGTLHLEVNTLTQPAGPHAWRVVVRYRAAGQLQEMALVLSAFVVTEITVQPTALMIYTDTTVTHEITLTDARAHPLTVTEARTTSPHLRARPEEARRDDAGRRTQTVRLEVLADYPEGRHDEMVTLLTNDADYRELKVPATIVKRSRQQVSVAPSSVTLMATGGVFSSRLVLIRGNDEEPVEVERVEADNPALVCQGSRGPNPTATVRVGADKARVPEGGLRATVRVFLSKPTKQTLTIPVTCAPR
jgi:hypothetical protein